MRRATACLFRRNVCAEPAAGRRQLHTSRASHEFHEFDKRSGYDTGLEVSDSRLERIRMGFRQLKEEIKLWKHEMREIIESDPILDYRAGT